MRILSTLSVILLLNYAQCSAHQNPFIWTPPTSSIKELNPDPGIYLIENFVTDQEAERLKELAAPKFQRSKVGQSEISDGRTSYTAFFNPAQDETTKAIAKRAADMVGQPAEHVEFQIVHYEPGQKFDPHHDYFSEEMMKKRKSQRLMTFFVYLNDLEPDAGGETVFPKINVTIIPKKNTAVFWRDLDEQNNKDERTLHGGNPVKHGEKWAINIWMHNQKPG